MFVHLHPVFLPSPGARRELSNHISYGRLTLASLLRQERGRAAFSGTRFLCLGLDAGYRANALDAPPLNYLVADAPGAAGHELVAAC